MAWEYTLDASRLASLEGLLDDGTVDLIMVGKRSKINLTSLGETTFTITDPPPMKVVAAPEPATILLMGSGLIGRVGYGRKKFFKK